MAPHRMAAPAASFLGLTPQAVVVGGGIGAGIIAALAPWVGEWNARLCIAAAVASGIDAIAGVLRAAATPKEKVTPGALYAGVVKKLRRSLLISLGALVDWSLRLFFPSLDPLLAAVMPFTRLALIGYIGAEGLSIARNIVDVVRIPGAMTRMLKAMEEGDVPEMVVAMREVDAAQVPPGVQPDRRWSDQLPAAASGADPVGAAPTKPAET